MSRAPRSPAADSERDDSIGGGGVSVVPQVGHTDDIDAVAFLPDGRRALSASDDQTLKLWDTRAGALLQTLRGHAEPIKAIALSRDGKRALSGGALFPGHQNTLRLWDLETGALLQTIDGLAYRPSALAFLPDGRRALVGGAVLENSSSSDQSVATLVLWDLEAGSRIRELDVRARWVEGLDISHDGRRAVVGLDKAAGLWDLETGEALRLFGGLPAAAAVFSPDDRRVLCGGSRVFDVETGESVGELEGSPSRPLALRSSPDGGRVLGIFGRLWDTATADAWRWDTLRRIAGPTPLGDAKRAAISPDCTRALLGNPDGGPEEDWSPSPKLQLWDLVSARKLRSLDGRIHRWTAAAYSRDGRSALAATPSGQIALWNLETGALVRTLGPHDENPDVVALALSPDGRRALSGHADRRDNVDRDPSGSELIVLWDLATGDRLCRLKVRNRTVNRVAFSDDGARALSADSSWWIGTTRTWNLDTGALLTEAPGEKFTAVAFSSDGQRVLWAGGDGVLRLCELETGALVQSIHAHELKADDLIRAVAISPDGTLAVSVGDERTVKIWSLASGVLLRTTSWASRAGALAFTPDGGHVLVGFSDGSIAVVGVERGEVTRSLLGHSAALTAIEPSGSGEHALSIGSDGTMRVWRLATGASFAMASAGGEWIVYDDAGNFDASRDGGRLVAAVMGERGFRVDQLAARNNRPDLVLAPVGLTRPDLLSHYRSRHEHRLRRLGMDEEQLTVRLATAPQVAMTSVTQNGKFAEVTFTARGTSLFRYNIWVNDVPLFGIEGKPVSGRSMHLRERIELTSGPNKIEVGVLDSTGTESLRDLHTLECAEDAGRELYVLAFGVSRHRDSRLDLGYAHQDARDLAAVFERMKGRFFRNTHVRTWTNAEVTRPNIERAKELLRSVSVDDTVVVFVAGHGTHTRDAAADYYYVTHDTDPERLRETGAPFEVIEDLLRDIASRRKLLLIDTCESGERDPMDEAAALSDASGRGLRARVARDLKIRPKPTPARSGPLRPRPFLLERDRFIYNDVARRTGAVVFSSSRGSELSYERDDWGNGAFTAEIKLALTTNVADRDRDGMVSMDELRSYVRAAVAARTGDLQHPTVDRDNLEAKFGFPIVRAAGG